MPKAKKHSYKVLLGTFVFFIVLLFGGTLLLPYLAGLRTVHISASASMAMEPWMSLVPSTADTVDFANISYAVADGLNTSAGVPFLNIYQTNQKLTFDNVTYLFSYGIPASNPNNNETGVDVYVTPASVYASIESALAASTNLHRDTYKKVTIFTILNEVSPTDLEAASMALYGGNIYYRQGTSSPVQEIEAALDVAMNSPTSLFANRTVQLTVYAVAGNTTNYMALHYFAYTSEIPKSDFAAKSIVGAADNYTAVYAFGFNNTSLATSNSQFVTSTYQHGLQLLLSGQLCGCQGPGIPRGALH